MNICLLSKYYLQAKIGGGIETYTNTIAHALTRLGNKAHIITLGENDEDLNEDGVYIHKIKIKNIVFRGSWRIERIFPLSQLAYSRSVSNKINQLVKDLKIDIVESPDWGFEGLWYLFKRKIPVVVRLHGGMVALIYNNMFPITKKNKMTMWLEKFLIAHADLVTSPSKSIVKIVGKSYGIRRNKIIIPNAIRLDLFFPKGELEAKEPLVLFVGRLEINKGIHILAEAIPKVIAKFPEVKFCFIGWDMGIPKSKATWKEYLMQKIDNKNMVFINPLPQGELVAFYQKSWICVFPSLYETFGNVALEAMACGKPVVATDIGGFAENIENNKQGLLVPTNDPDSLAKGINILLKDSNLRKTLGENARNKIESNFDINQIAGLQLKEYESAIKKFQKKIR